jgi:hypothetical protein
LPRLFCIREAEVEWVLARQERCNEVTRELAPEVRAQMTQVVLFRRADRTIGEKGRNTVSA